MSQRLIRVCDWPHCEAIADPIAVRIEAEFIATVDLCGEHICAATQLFQQCRLQSYIKNMLEEQPGRLRKDTSQ